MDILWNYTLPTPSVCPSTGLWSTLIYSGSDCTALLAFFYDNNYMNVSL